MATTLRASFLIAFLPWFLACQPTEQAPRGDSRPPQAAPPAPAPTAITLRVAVWDDTDTRPLPGGTEIWLRGVGSWAPDLSFGSESRDFRGRELGTTDTLMFYPAGRDGPEVPVRVELTSDLCPAGCDRDIIHLEIGDDAYVVWGPIAGGRVEVAR